MGNLDPAMRERIDAILAAAAAEGRHSLFEHEVYGILDAIGLETPRFRFVREPRDVDDAVLAGFGHTVVLKIVSADVPHKSRVGGVRKVATTDPLYVQYALERMRAEVSERVPGLRLHGFLVVENVPHTQAIGYEVLIGFREDPGFGPVLTVSKGGDDAEFFAENYDPANLFLPPLGFAEALRFMQSLHIRRKFEQIGHPEYLAHMARAIAGLSGLAETYSPVSSGAPFVFESFEVNPFAISRDGRFVALDGLAELRPLDAGDRWGGRGELCNLASFFRPRGIAVVGVSSDPSKYSLGRDIAELLVELGREDVHLVNPKGGSVSIDGRQYPLEPDVAGIRGDVELVVYAAPAPAAPDCLRSLAGGRVRAVILIPGVPSSIGWEAYAAAVAEATPPGVRVLGPNCMGVFSAPEGADPGLNTLFINRKRLEVVASERSNVALLTQSGALAVTALDKLTSSRVFRAVVSYGNKLDVKASELLAWFAADPRVDVISLYVEGVDRGEGRAIFEEARELLKPVIAYKGGRTAAGARSAASHTAAISGSYEVFRAACQQAGIILAETIEEYYDLIRTFSLLAGRVPAGNRVAGVVNAGFESTIGGDELRGLAQARLAPATVAALNRVNRSGLVDTGLPFLDLTPMADDATYAEFVSILLADPEVDCVFVAVVPHAVTLKTVPETCRDPDGLAARLVALARGTRKPMVVSVNAGRHYADFVSVLEEGGLPVYEDIRSAIASLDRYVGYWLGRRQDIRVQGRR